MQLAGLRRRGRQVPAGPPVFVSLVCGLNTMTLNWTNADAYSSTQIWMSTGGAYAVATTQATGVTSFVFSTGSNLTASFFLVHIYNGVSSVPSTTKTTTSGRTANTPSCSITSTGPVTAQLGWSSTESGAGASVTVAWYTSGGSFVGSASGLTGSSGVVSVSGLAPGTAYYAVATQQIIDGCGITEYTDSAQQPFTTAPLLAPSGLSVTHLGSQDNGLGGCFSTSWTNTTAGAQTSVNVQATIGGSTVYNATILAAVGVTSATFNGHVAPDCSVTVSAVHTLPGGYTSSAATTSGGPFAGPSVGTASGSHAGASITFAWTGTVDKYFAALTGPGATVTSLGPFTAGTTTYNFSATVPDSYSFQITGWKNGWSTLSNTPSVSVGPSVPALNVSVFAMGSPDAIHADVGGNVLDTVFLESSLDGGASWNLVDSNTHTLSLDDFELIAGHTAMFRAHAERDGLSSAYATASITAP